MNTIVTLKTTQRQYLVGEWREVGTQEENEQKRISGKMYFISHYGEKVAHGVVIRNGKPFGRIRTLFSSQVIF